MEDDDLALLVDLEYVEKESKLDPDFLPKEEQHWEIQVYGRHADQLDGTIDAEYSFEMGLELDEDTETVLDVVYPHIVNRFEEEYGGRVDRLQYLDPEDLND